LIRPGLSARDDPLDHGLSVPARIDS
jgi:hypothetical protein